MSATTATNPAVIDTGRVTNRRTLRFETIDQALAEVDRLVAAEREGRLTQLGNWTLGQALGHVAAWAEYGYVGFPIKAPFFVRWILIWRKRKYLYDAMPAGVNIPRVAGGTLATEPMSLDEGVSRLRAIFERLMREPHTHPSPIFGMLTHEESIAINLRHAELHLGFFVPE
jgi:hypothetical protein